MIRAAILALIAAPAAADMVSLSGTIVTMRDSHEPGALAEVHMRNSPVNGTRDERAFTLSHRGLTVGAEFDWDADATGADALTLTPPDGVLCVPAACVLVLPEHEEGAITLYPTESVGF